MPYIKNEITRVDGKPRRKEMDRIVCLMLQQGVKADGDLNYILFKFAKTIVPSYNNYKNFCGELRQCATEIERRLLAPYEDEKCKENGDVI
jgi:hypothetical protein